jgi:general stress protein 26
MAEMDHAQVEQRMWKAIGDDRLGMLGPHRRRAVASLPADELLPRGGDPHLWFYSYKDNKLAGPLGSGGGHEAMFNFVDKDRQVWACVMGTLSVNRSQEHIDKFWDAQAKAWFAEGKDDPTSPC